MKFELFGKLRGNGDDTSPEDQQVQGSGMAGDQGMQIGGSLDRTIENMFNQGYSEEEIKNELSGQYSPDEIQSAINNAVASNAQSGSSEGGPEPMTPYQRDQEDEAVSPMDEGYSKDEQQPPQQEQEPIQHEGGQEENQPAPSRRGADPATEELIETIVAENLDTIFNQFEDVFRDIDEMKDKIDELEQRVHDLEVRDDEDQHQFVQKVDEMEEHIDSYQSRIGGLEKAFQQILPSLVDNVQDLTALVQEIKKQNNIQTEREVPSNDMEDMEMEGWN